MNIKKWHVAGILFTIVLGTLDHFFYDWSGGNPLVATFSAVNESTWEHLKLLVFPMLLFSALEYVVYGRFISGFIPAKVLSVLAGMGAIILLFYGYTALAPSNYLWADIATFVISVIIAWSVSYVLITREVFSSIPAELTSRVILAVLLVCFLLFTVTPPHVFLFEDPVTGQYGL